MVRELLGLFGRRLGAVGRAAAFALAGVLAFAAVIAGLAAAFALARVLAFTSVLFLHLLGGLLVLGLVLRAQRRPQPRKQVGCVDSCATAGKQSRQRCACHQGLL